MTWKQSTFVFISTNVSHHIDGVEERWLPVMAELVKRGATVQFLCFAESPSAQPAADAGVNVAPYILDRWNVVRSRSRLRKYLRRYVPVCAHSTGVEADLLLRWAARKVPEVRVATTLALATQQRTRRKGPVDALMQYFDDAGLASADVVFVEGDASLPALRSAGLPAEKIIVDPPPTDAAERAESVKRHLAVYQGFLLARGMGR